MSRDGITNAYVSSSVPAIYAYYGAYLDFSGSAPVRLWTGNKDQVFTDFSGSATYSAVGTLGSISAVSETTELSAKNIDLTLSGIPSSYISLALQNPYRGRTAAVYLFLYNEAHTSYTQTMLFRGRMDQMVIQEGSETSTITVKCESRLVDFNRPRETRYTNEYQQSVYPGDTGLEFIAGMGDKAIYWGQSAPATTVSNPGSTPGGDGNSNES